MQTVQIENNANFLRDMKTHAVININNAEYNSYIRQRQLLEIAKNDAAAQVDTITNMQNDIAAMKVLLAQLLNKESDDTSTTSK